MATYYWIGGAGTWDNANTTNWSASSGGASGSGPPTNTDDVVFDANSGSGVCTVSATAEAAAVGLTLTNLSVVLGASTTPFGAVTLTSGTLNLAGFELTCTTFLSSNANARTIAFGASTGVIVITGNNANVFSVETATNLSVTGNPVVRSTYSGSTGTRTFLGGANIGEARAFSLFITAGSDIFGATSGSGRGFKNINFIGFSGSWAANTAALAIFGDLTLSATMTVTDGAGIVNFSSTGTQTIQTNGVQFKRPLYKGGAGTLTMLDNFTSGAGRGIELFAGTLNSNGFAVNTTSYTTSGTTAKNLQFSSSTWTVTGTSWNGNVASLTVTPGTGVINMTSASAKTFQGGGKTWPTLNQGGAGALIIQQSSTFANITNTVQPATITFTAGTTQTVGAFNVAGTNGNLITLNSSSAGSTATLSGGNVINSVSFVSIKDIIATGGTVWSAPTANGNVDAGNNTGWNFNDLLFRYIYNRRKNKVIYPI